MYSTLGLSLGNIIINVNSSFAKLIFEAKYSDHMTPLLKELHWLKVHESICFIAAVGAYVFYKGLYI